MNKTMLIIICLLPSFLYSQWQQNEFAIGTFVNPNLTFNNQTADQNAILLARNAGINLLTWPNDSDPQGFTANGISWTLDICSQTDMQLIATDSRHMIRNLWFNYTPASTFNQTTADNVSTFYSTLTQTQRDHLYGFYIVDEPSPTAINSSHLPVVRSWISHFKNSENNRVALIDLLPVYAIDANLQNFTTLAAYENYLDDYLNGQNPNSNPEIAATNNYLYSHLSSPQGVRYFYNMKILQDKANSRPCWGHVDVRQKSDLYNPDRSYIRFGVNSYLAYGFKGIVYFPYDNNSTTIVNNGNPTNKYPWVQELNTYINNVVGPAIMSSHYLGTYHKSDFVDANNSIIETIPSSQKLSLQTPFLYNLSHNKSMAGIFYDDIDNYVYLYIVNKGYGDTHGNITVSVTLYGDLRNKIYTTPTTGPNFPYSSVTATYNNNFTYFTVSGLQPGQGRLYRIKNSGFGKWNVTYTGYGNSTYHPVPADYDGDGKTDLSVKTDDGYWKIDYANNGYTGWNATYSLNSISGTAVPADYDGDGKTDISIKSDLGIWYINYAADGFIDSWDASYSGYGNATNHPVPADYDGDGKADLSVKTDDGYWKIDYANNGFTGWNATYSQYGAADARPVPADYDGDGKADLSIKADWGTWYINYSANGFSGGWDITYTGFGDATFHAVPADYDGDGKADLSVKTDGGEGGEWNIDFSRNGFGSLDESHKQYGGATSIPVPADYDGNRKADLSVKTNLGQWYIDYQGYQQNYLNKSSSASEELSEEELIPLDFNIGNYPNPFNPSTKIHFTIPEQSHIKLEVFNMLGEKIVTLVDDLKESGEYTVDFNGANLPSGMYIYTLNNGTNVKSGKMVLLK